MSQGHNMKRDTKDTSKICGVLLTFGFAALAILLVLGFSWYCILIQPNKIQVQREIIYVSDTLPHLKNAKQKNDSVLLAQKLAETATLSDSLKTVVATLDKNYHDNVDLMINKANGWIAFWIGIFGVIVSVVAMWQIFRQYKFEERFKSLEEESRGIIGRGLGNTRKVLKTLQREQERKLNNLGQRVDAYNNEIIMSSVMMCVSITDPLASPDNIEWQKQVTYFLRKLKDSYSEYLRTLEKSNDSNKFYKISLILVSIKLAIVRALPVFPSYEKNVSFFILKQNIETVIDDLVEKCNNTEGLLTRLYDIEKDFSKMLSSISFITNPTLSNVNSTHANDEQKAVKADIKPSSSEGGN